jgi:hypothetical protein
MLDSGDFQLQCDSMIYYCLGRLIIYCALHLVFHVFLERERERGGGGGRGYWFLISYSFLFPGVTLGPSLIS